MKKIYLIFITFVLIAVLSCEKDKGVTIKREKINGVVQKGPFNNGTSILIFELTDKLNQTGRNFNTQIIDNRGSFEFNDIELESQYVELKAFGYYFNEVNGKNSISQLTLYALTDLQDSSSINVNILSHLEKQRVEYLVLKGNSFNDSKKQAQKEILKMFNIKKDDIKSSEYLNITKSGEDNAILLAVSAIMQGYRTEAQLSEILANISTDIREDGILNNLTIGTSIINQAKHLNRTEIRKNLEKKYSDLGVNITIPDFEKFIQIFIDNSSYEFTAEIKYPTNGNYGKNMLVKTDTVFTGGDYSITADLPAGCSLKIVHTGTWGGIGFLMKPSAETGWKFEGESNGLVTYSSVSTGLIDNMVIITNVKSSFTIYYYENNMTDPSFVKVIHVQ